MIYLIRCIRKNSGYRVIRRGKATGVWRWPPTPSSVKVKERVERYIPLLLIWALVACSRVDFTCFYMRKK